MILFRLRFVPSQVRRKNKDAPSLGYPKLLVHLQAVRDLITLFCIFSSGCFFLASLVLRSITSMARKAATAAFLTTLYDCLQ